MKINIFSKSVNGSFEYECSTETKDNCTKAIINFWQSCNIKSVEYTQKRNFIHMKTPVNNYQFRNKDIVYFYASFLR